MSESVDRQHVLCEGGPLDGTVTDVTGCRSLHVHVQGFGVAVYRPTEGRRVGLPIWRHDPGWSNVAAPDSEGAPVKDWPQEPDPRIFSGFTPSISETWEPLSRFRILRCAGQPDRLQQVWRKWGTSELKWEDVPVVSDEPKPWENP